MGKGDATHEISEKSGDFTMLVTPLPRLKQSTHEDGLILLSSMHRLFMPMLQGQASASSNFSATTIYQATLRSL